MKLKPISEEDAVLFDTREQLSEYVQLSDCVCIFPADYRLTFPIITSKYWSFSVPEPAIYTKDQNSFTIKQNALKALVSYEAYKAKYTSEG